MGIQCVYREGSNLYKCKLNFMISSIYVAYCRPFLVNQNKGSKKNSKVLCALLKKVFYFLNIFRMMWDIKIITRPSISWGCSLLTL